MVSTLNPPIFLSHSADDVAAVENGKELRDILQARQLEVEWKDYEDLSEPNAPSPPVTICEPFQVIIADSAGLFDVSDRGHRYIFCQVDMFSRYGEAEASTKQDADAALDCTAR
ncbi:hypothetical protein GGR50DRAFT_695208 [Xylaria sp. CBS 124048]|nr:hypothetical protein GGR50DRAFT_695208 [Xylaria sp. CBS 124048]